MPIKRKSKPFRSRIRRWFNHLRFSVDVPQSCLTTREWVQQNNSITDAADYKTIDASYPIEYAFPKNIDSIAHWKFRQKQSVLSPETYVATLANGRIFSHYGVVITSDNQILRDVSIDFKSSQETHFLLDRGKLPRAKSIKGKVAVLISKGSHHYFHWVFDSLPRFDLLERSEIEVDQYVIDQRSSFHHEYLRLLGIAEEKIIPIQKNTHLQADELIVPSLPGKTGYVTQQSCAFLRKIIQEAFPNMPQNLECRRVYISRANAEKRRVLNEKKVIELLKSYGFKVLVLETLSVMEQVACFASAEIIVAPHGAGLTNLVYCRANTKVIEFFSPRYVNPCYWMLCEQVKLCYSYLIGEGDLPPDGVDPHEVGADMKISIEQLSQVFESLSIRRLS